MAIQIFKPK